MKFKRYNNYKKILNRHYENQMDFYIAELNQAEEYCDILKRDITTLIMIVEHYEEILKDSGIEFESLLSIFRNEEDL